MCEMINVLMCFTYLYLDNAGCILVKLCMYVKYILYIQVHIFAHESHD